MQSPKGVFTRTEADFAGLTVGIGHGDFTANFTNPRIALYNNAVDGTVLEVFRIMAILGVAGGRFYLRFAFGAVGTFQRAAFPFRVGDATPWGQMFTSTDPQQAHNYSNNVMMLFPIVRGGIISSEYPLAVVSPGYSLIAQYESNTSDAPCVHFWYTLGRR